MFNPLPKNRSDIYLIFSIAAQIFWWKDYFFINIIAISNLHL